MRIYLLLLCVYSVLCNKYDEKKYEENRKEIFEKLTKNRTVLIPGYQLVTRQITTDIYTYRSYRDVSTVLFLISGDVTHARFTFHTEEVHLNNIGSCGEVDLIVDMKRGSYPAVTPDKLPFPKNFIDRKAREPMYHVQLATDETKHFDITNPKPGNWYALVYLPWVEPKKASVQQHGLSADCSTVFYSDLQVKREEYIKVIDCYLGTTVNDTNIPVNFKCMSLDNIEPISFKLTVTDTKKEIILIRVQALALPTEKEYIIACVFDPSLNNAQTISFTPHLNSWHYIHLEHIKNGSKYADCESYVNSAGLEEPTINHTLTDLMRDDKGRFFTFEYGLPTTDIEDATSVINITSNEIKTLRFEVNQFIDVGGNLEIQASFLMSAKYYMGFRRDIQDGLLEFTENNQFLKAVICISIGHASVPMGTGHCQFNDNWKPALFVLNTTDSESIYQKVIIPYPESGTWYLTMRLFCDGLSVCPCRKSADGSKYYVMASSSDKDKGVNVLDHSNYTRAGVTECNASMVLSLSSATCLGGKCKNDGNCMLNTVGGLVLSFCYCTGGYLGWDCSDDSRIDGLSLMYETVLLLTLSNIPFMITVYIAIIRRYYTEAVMYSFTMFFSTFYHACDADQQVSLCIMHGKLLQFADFYSGIMCFWVTLLAMSILGDKLRGMLHLIGAVVIALLTTWNMHNIVTFMVPVGLGTLIFVLSLGWNYKQFHNMGYPKSYYIKHFPIGIILVSLGLVCFAFLQTAQNYLYVHSLWHCLIALSVVFLLPDAKREFEPNPFLPNFKLS